MDSNGNSMPKRSWPAFSRRRYWPPDPSDHFLEMSRRSAIVCHGRPKIGMCENWVRHPRGGACWAISRSEIDAPDHRNRSQRQFDAETGLARFPLGVTDHRSVQSFVELKYRSCAVIALKLGCVRSRYVAVGSLVGPLAVST